MSECLPVSPGNHNREGTIVGDHNKGGETTWMVWKEMEVTVSSPRGSCTVHETLGKSVDHTLHYYLVISKKKPSPLQDYQR